MVDTVTVGQIMALCKWLSKQSNMEKSDRKCKTSICDLYTIFQSISVSPNPFLVNTAHAFRYMGLNLTFWPLLVIF